MKLKSHIAIGKYTFDILSSKMDFFIPLDIFLNGTILPDILPSERKYIHNFDRTLSFLNNAIQNIQNTSLNTYELSNILGMVTHYLTDSFCLAHNLFHNNLIRHVAYEFGINKSIKKLQPMDKSFLYFDFYMLSPNLSYSYLEKYLKSLHQTYLSQIHPIDKLNYELDISYAIHACSMIIGNILGNINLDTLPKAANI